MNLNEYFHQQKNVHISDTQKLDLYQDFMVKNMKRHYHAKRSILQVKSVVYSLVIVFLLFGFYGMYFLNNQGGEYDALISNMAEAGYIAKIVDFNGSFYIVHNGQKTQTSNIHDGDLVTLNEKTQVIFEINTGTKTKLIGPAKFSVQQVGDKKDSQYKLNIIKGDYIEMKTSDKGKDQVQLNIQDVLTLQGSNHSMDFQLIKEGDKHIIKNNGGKLLVTTIGENNQTVQTSIENQQILAVQKNDIALFDNIEKFTKAIKSNNISQTFTFNSATESIQTLTTDTGSDNQELQEVSLPSLLETQDEAIDPNVSNQMGAIFLDTQKTPTPDQLQAIRGSLNKDFLLGDLEQLYLSTLKGDAKEIDFAFDSVEKKISTLYNKFDLKYTNTDNITELQKSITLFINIISKNYLMPPKYFDNLYALNNWLTDIGGIKAQTGISEEVAQKVWDNLILNLPSRLVFQ